MSSSTCSPPPQHGASYLGYRPHCVHFQIPPLSLRRTADSIGGGRSSRARLGGGRSRTKVAAAFDIITEREFLADLNAMPFRAAAPIPPHPHFPPRGGKQCREQHCGERCTVVPASDASTRQRFMLEEAYVYALKARANNAA